MEMDGQRGGEDLGGDGEKETVVRICFMKKTPKLFLNGKSHLNK